MGASEHATEEQDEDEVPPMADFTHLAAAILDQAIQRISARPRNDRLKILDQDLKRDVIEATHTPLTRDDLARRSATGPGKKPKTGGLWPTTLESISRAIAAYNNLSIRRDHAQCEDVVINICAYAHTLRVRTRRPHEFIKVLHQWIENRSINMALKNTLNAASEPPSGMFTEQTVWRRCNAEERVRAEQILRTSLDIVGASGDMIREDIGVQHEYN